VTKEKDKIKELMESSEDYVEVECSYLENRMVVDFSSKRVDIKRYCRIKDRSKCPFNVKKCRSVMSDV
jgi:hypothetical protein